MGEVHPIQGVAPKVHVPWLQHEHELPPEYKTEGAAGCDLVMAFPHIDIFPGETTPLPTGLSVAIPIGYFGFIKERSSIAKKGCCVLGGIIDSDYRGELFINLHNSGRVMCTFNGGDRIANLIIIPYVRARFFAVKKLEETSRGSGGYGSTGR